MRILIHPLGVKTVSLRVQILRGAQGDNIIGEDECGVRKQKKESQRDSFLKSG